jgi:hypothetical protein
VKIINIPTRIKGAKAVVLCLALLIQIVNPLNITVHKMPQKAIYPDAKVIEIC